jgi:hypothetical protein
MALVTGSNALARLVEALGLQQRRVRALTVSVRRDEVVTVVAEMLADEEQLDALADTLTADVPPRVVEVPGGLPEGRHEFRIDTIPDAGSRSRVAPFTATYAEAMARGTAAAGEGRAVLLRQGDGVVASWFGDGTMTWRLPPGREWSEGRWRDV